MAGKKSGRRDSNPGPLEPHSSALSRLRYAPNDTATDSMQPQTPGATAVLAGGPIQLSVKPVPSAVAPATARSKSGPLGERAELQSSRFRRKRGTYRPACGASRVVAVGAAPSPEAEIALLPPYATRRAPPRAAGSRMMNRVPAPSLLSTRMLPPAARTSSRQTASPRPLPPSPPAAGRLVV